MKRQSTLLWQLILAAVLALGAGLLEWTVVVLLSELVGPAGTPREVSDERQFVGLTDQGDPVFARLVPETADEWRSRLGQLVQGPSFEEKDGFQIAFSDLAGNPVSPGTWSWAANIQAGVLAAPMTKRVLSGFGFNGKVWYLVCGPDSAFVVVEDQRTGDPVSYCGTAGFRDGPLPDGELFRGLRGADTIPASSELLLDCGSRLLVVDFAERTTEVLLDHLASPLRGYLGDPKLSPESGWPSQGSYMPGGDRPVDDPPFPGAADNYFWIPSNKQFHNLHSGRTSAGLVLCNEESIFLTDVGTFRVTDEDDEKNQPFKVRTIPLPAALRDRSFVLSQREDGGLIVAVPQRPLPGATSIREQVFELSADGTLGPPRELELPYRPSAARSRDWARLLPLASPLLQTINSLRSGGDAATGFATPSEAMRDAVWRDRVPLAGVWLVGAVLGLACYRRQARYDADLAERIVWSALVFLLGIPGWIGYRYRWRWPAIEPCPTCHRPVPRDRERCAFCHAEFPIATAAPAVGFDRDAAAAAALHRPPQTMLAALAMKELRDVAGIAALATLVTGLILLVTVRESTIRLPLEDDGFLHVWTILSVFLALALALRQSVWDGSNGTYTFLLSKPAERSKIFACKLAVGIAVLQTVSALPIVALGLWAGSAGSSGKPFDWWMTDMAWLVWTVLPVVYLAAFLTGMLPARWLGTRALPAAGGVVVVLVASQFQNWRLPIDASPWLSAGWPLGLAAGLALSAALIVALFHVARTRDFG